MKQKGYHETPTPYFVRVPVMIQVDAHSKDEAVETALAFLEADLHGYNPVLDESNTVARKDWEMTALAMLEDGASYNQVATSLGLSRARLSDRFPGYGWTREEGVVYREMKKRVDRASL